LSTMGSLILLDGRLLASNAVSLSRSRNALRVIVLNPYLSPRRYSEVIARVQRRSEESSGAPLGGSSIPRLSLANDARVAGQSSAALRHAMCQSLLALAFLSSNDDKVSESERHATEADLCPRRALSPRAKTRERLAPDC